MFRRVLVTACAAAVALAWASSAAGQTGIELTGSGRAVLSLRGAVLGAVEQGRITIRDFAGGEDTEILVQGYDWSRALDEDTTTYGGEEIRFRVFRGSWLVRIRGLKIDASAVGSGIVGLEGRGRFSVGGAPYRPWPAEYETLRLGLEE
jgi:hypothetical protein